MRARSWFALYLGAVTAKLAFRRWHLHWGATSEEVRASMPGDGLVPTSHFTATRAITIEAPPEEVWPWIVQVGIGRGGFYSYDFLDNPGRHSAEEVLEEWQHPQVGDVAAPMVEEATDATSFRVHIVVEPHALVWSKRDSSWAWQLTPLDDGARTRLVTRLRQHYRLGDRWLPATVLVLELADFPMMRRMLLGIRDRAEGRAP